MPKYCSICDSELETDKIDLKTFKTGLNVLLQNNFGRCQKT